MKKTLITLFFACSLLVSLTACKEQTDEISGEVVFTAEVLEVYEHGLLVDGLGWDKDDVNFKGTFNVTVSYSDYDGEVALLDESGEPITLSDFAEGDIVEVTFRGMVTLSSPAGIGGTIAIQKLNPQD